MNCEVTACTAQHCFWHNGLESLTATSRVRCHSSPAFIKIVTMHRIVLDDIVQLGWHFSAIESWAAAVQQAAASDPAGGSPYCVALAAGFTGGRLPGIVVHDGSSSMPHECTAQAARQAGMRRFV